MAHFDKYKIRKDNQHGFRKKLSCETQLVITIQEIASRFAKGDQVDANVVGFGKAFNKVAHSRLLYKLEYCGVRGMVLNWIRTFMSNRKQQVVLLRIWRRTCRLLSEVSQGTVLGLSLH